MEQEVALLLQSVGTTVKFFLQLFEELACRTRDIDTAWHAALAILHSFDDAG